MIRRLTIKKYLSIAIGAFLVILTLAIGISAKFSLLNITANPYQFIEDFIDQWSPALSATGTVILALLVLWTYNRGQEREKEQAIHALHDEIHSNLTDIVILRCAISEYYPKAAPLEEATAIDTAVFDNMKNSGQLHWLGDIRMNVIFCYKLIKRYNQDAAFKGSHLKLLAKVNEGLDKAIRNLEKNFKFLPTYLFKRDESELLMNYLIGVDKLSEPLSITTGVPRATVATGPPEKEEVQKRQAQKRLDEDERKVGYLRGELYQLEDGSWGIHWGGKYPL